MSTQISLRLPDAMVRFLDRNVADGLAGSRAEAVSRALQREYRRQMAERDAAILRETGTDDGLEDLVRWNMARIRGGEDGRPEVDVLDEADPDW